MNKPVLTKDEKITMRQVVRIPKRWKRVSWSWLFDGVKKLIVWVEQKKSVDYYTKNLDEIKVTINRFYDAEEDDNTEDEELVFGYMNKLVKHYGGKE